MEDFTYQGKKLMFKAYHKERKEWFKVLAIDWEERRATLVGHGIRFFPSFDEIALRQESKHC